MNTKRKSNAVKFLEKRAGPLTLGGLLAAIRKGDGISQAEFARTLNLSRSHLCDLEKGRKAASPARAAQMAKQLGYSPEQFVRLALQALVEEAGLRLKVTVTAA